MGSKQSKSNGSDWTYTLDLVDADNDYSSILLLNTDFQRWINTEDQIVKIQNTSLKISIAGHIFPLSYSFWKLYAIDIYIWTINNNKTNFYRVELYSVKVRDK